MEQKFNEIFRRYAHAYFDSEALTSVFLFDTEHAGFGGCFLIKKNIDSSKGIKEGSWDSIHVVTTDLEKLEGKARYRVTSTIFLKMMSNNPASYGNLEIAGNLTRSVRKHLNY